MGLLIKKLARLAYAKLGWLAAITATLIAAPIPASADGLISIVNISSGAIGWVAYGVSYLIGVVMGFFLLLEGYVLQVLLIMSINVTNSPLVRTGFPIALSFANLAFVLGIIIIAIATILGLQNYGMKNLLWKLLLMAIAVNFGLVIAGAVLSVSDNITMFFVHSTLPSGAGEISDFANEFAGVFQPQQALLFNGKDVRQTDADTWAAAIGGSNLGNMIAPIIGIGSSFVIEGIIVVVVGGLIVMLFVRYLYLALLLIGLPLAWAAWAFPAFKKNFSGWWEKFIQQAFFPPVVIFFLWLGMVTAGQLNSGGFSESIFKLQGSSSGGFWQGAANYLGGTLTPLLDVWLRTILLGGIMIAGIIAAQKLNVSFASNTMNAMKGAGGRLKSEVTTRTGRRMKQAGLAIKESSAGLQKGALKKFLIPTAAKSGNALRNLTGGRADTRAKLTISAKVVNKDGTAIGDAVMDHSTHTWKKDEHGNYLYMDGGIEKAEIGGRISIGGAKMSAIDGTFIRDVSKDELKENGLIAGNKLISPYVNKDTLRAIAEPTIAKMQRRMEEIEHGSYEIDARKKYNEVIHQMDESGGLFKGLVVAPVGDGAKALVSKAQAHKAEHGGKKEDKGGHGKESGGGHH